MPDAIIEEPTQAESANIPRSEGFNNMASQLDKLMSEVVKQPAEHKVDASPTKLPEATKEPIKIDEATLPPKQDEPVKEPPKADDMPANPKAADWKKLKTERDEWQKKYEAVSKYEKESAELKAKLSEVQTKFNPEEIETIRKERQTLAEHLERVALEQTPKFKDYYDSKFESALSLAVDSVGKEQADKIKAVLEAPRSKWRKDALNEIIGGMENEVDKLQLLSAVNRYDEVRGEREKQLADHKTNMSKYREVEAQRQKEAEQADENRRRELVTGTLKKAVEKFESFKEIEGNAEHNESVKKAHSLVERFIMGSMNSAEVLTLPLRAAEYDRLSKIVPTLEARVKEQEEALAALRGASPKPGEQPSTPPAGDQGKPKGFVDAVRAAWPGVV